MCLFWLVDRVVVFAGVGGGVDLVVGGVSVSGVACASGVVVCVCFGVLIVLLFLLVLVVVLIFLFVLLLVVVFVWGC